MSRRKCREKQTNKTRSVFPLIELLACRGEAHRTRRSSNFTLIELLVVIAIIADLAAILMPALGKSKKLTERAVCSNNLRQLAIAINSYAFDYDGRLPVGMQSAEGVTISYSSPLGAIVAYKYVTIPARVRGTPAEISAAGWTFSYAVPDSIWWVNDLTSGSVLDCPTAVRKFKETWSGGGGFVPAPGQQTIPASSTFVSPDGKEYRARASGGSSGGFYTSPTWYHASSLGSKTNSTHIKGWGKAVFLTEGMGDNSYHAQRVTPAMFRDFIKVYDATNSAYPECPR